MKKSNDPRFSTLIIVPNRWRSERAISSLTTMFITWDKIDTLRGYRFDQIVAIYPPTNAAESAAWAEVTRRLNPSGTAFWM